MVNFFQRASLLLGVFIIFTSSLALAQYNRTFQSRINPAIFRIDESKVLGVKVDGTLALIDANGDGFMLSEMLGKPLLIVFSYFICDGSCSLTNAKMAGLFGDTERQKLGDGFQVLTLSFE